MTNFVPKLIAHHFYQIAKQVAFSLIICNQKQLQEQLPCQF